MTDGYQAAWDEFVRRGRVSATFAGWAANWPGRSSFLLYLISLAECRPLARAARSIQRDLATPFVIPVPGRALHVSVQSVDFAANLSSQRLAALVADGRRALRGLEPFTLDVRNANSFEVAAYLEAHDASAVLDIRARLRGALPWLAEEGRDPFVRNGRDDFLPHVSIAYYGADTANRQIVEALGPHRQQEIAQVSISEIKLVRVPKPTNRYRWHWPVVATFRLGDAGVPSAGGTRR